MPRQPIPLSSALAPLLIAALLAADAHAAGPAPRLEADVRANTLERAGKRSDALVRDDTLTDIARSHSQSMYEAGTLAHELPDGVGPGDRLARRHRTLFGLVSENVAFREGQPRGRSLAARLVDGWMKSPGHRANILASYDTFEVGCFGDRETMYCTQLFLRSSTRLADEVPFRQPAGSELTVELAGPAAKAPPARRISVAPVGAAGSDPGVALTGGAARLSVPERPGLYQLKLWTAQEADPTRYRIIGGPYICATGSVEPAAGGAVDADCPGPG